jgi:UDP-glucose 4-epimerase
LALRALASKPSRILVTGGAGFIGSHIVDALLERGFEVGVLDDFSTGEKGNIARVLPQVRLHSGDIRDSSLVKRTVRDYEAIVHEAALVSVTRSVEDPMRTSSVNVDGTLNLLVAARDANIQKFVFASSSSVYGETEIQPKVESMAPQPVSPYAVSKLAAENYCRVFARVYGLRTVSLRYFNIYGPRQKFGPYSGVIPTFVNRVMNDEPPVIFGDGEQTRDFTYVEDAVSANILSLERNVDPGEVLNVAAGGQVTLNQLAASIEKLMGKTRLGVEWAPPRKGDVRGSRADISKAKDVLGYSPRYSLEEGLREVINASVRSATSLR